MSERNNQIQSYIKLNDSFSKLKNKIIDKFHENAKQNKEDKISLEDSYKFKYWILFFFKVSLWNFANSFSTFKYLCRPRF